MSRNGSGTQTTPNTFVAGTTITASDHNENWADAAAEITNSVAVDGQSTMTGQLKAASGTVALPGIAFGADTDSGLYRIGANNVGLAVNGAKVLDVATTGLDVTGTIKQSGSLLLPIGLGPLQWTGRTAPALWVLTGADYLRASYPDLWTFAQAEIAAGNTFYGPGNGSTTFTINTMDGYAPAGVDAAAARISSFTHVGDIAGSSTKTLAVDHLPPYTPAGSVSGTASVTSANWVASSSADSTAFSLQSGASGSIGVSLTGGSVSKIASSGSTSGTLSGTAQGGISLPFSLLQPSRAFKYIIYAGV